MDEAERLLEIERLHLLDTPPEPVFDAIVAAARAATGMTMGLISVVAEDRQWFKATSALKASAKRPAKFPSAPMPYARTSCSRYPMRVRTHVSPPTPW
nr:hypothetical protein [Stenotrophomonas maltophilia]